jgi:transposase InsO family protein
MGIRVGSRKGTALTIETLADALLHHPRPTIFHSDNGSEYRAAAYLGMLEACGIMISRSAPGSPWENSYQESLYDKFKVDLGDPSRFKTFGELVAEIYQTLWGYNHTRIHSALKMPAAFAEKLAA